MKAQGVVLLMSLFAVACCSAIQKRADSEPGSSRGSVSTVYSFLGATGSYTSLLQMPTSGVSIATQADSSSIDESSALSQFLNGARATSTAIATTSSGHAASTGGIAEGVSATGSAAQSSETSGTALSSASLSTSTRSASSTSSVSVTSAGAGVLRLPLVAGGMAAALLALEL